MVLSCVVTPSSAVPPAGLAGEGACWPFGARFQGQGACLPGVLSGKSGQSVPGGQGVRATKWRFTQPMRMVLPEVCDTRHHCREALMPGGVQTSILRISLEYSIDLTQCLDSLPDTTMKRAVVKTLSPLSWRLTSVCEQADSESSGTVNAYLEK